ncbi:MULTISPECIES: hypothetical protein [unclassified Nitrospina]|uniref:hypothetical protein n=1 Tax=unclassified Nitrospina TaxID=2638683 RepID=UPI003F983EF1
MGFFLGLSRIALVLALTILIGCTTTRIEYDRMTGTQYPQPETVSGAEVNLTTIYWQGERVVTVDENTTNIAPLTGPANPLDPDQYDYINPAELETLETANRRDPIGPVTFDCGFWNAFTCTRYHLYGVVVDHYREGDCGVACRSTTTLGLMYAGAGGATNDRSAFVSFWKNSTVNSDNAKYLRSTAHEVGHGFNLNHCDGDGSTTIMNSTGTVGDTYNYQFSASSLDHLQNHDDNEVWPGVSPRDYACPHVH